MRRRLKDFEQLGLRAVDGEIGRIDDALLDDRWIARYLVVTPGSWIRQRVVVSPMSVRTLDWARGIIELRLTSEQIQKSPDLLSVHPLTRDAEAAYAAHFGFAPYWGGPGLWAWADRPGALGNPPATYTPPANEPTGAALRSAKAYRGRHIAARDREIGHVDDPVLDADTWGADYLLVDTSNWIGGRHVLLPTSAIRQTDGVERNLAVELSSERIANAPEYDPHGVDAALERAIAVHYGLEGRAPDGGTRKAGT